MSRLHSLFVSRVVFDTASLADRPPILRWLLSRRTLAVMWCFGLIVFTLPPAVQQPGIGLDASWQLGLDMAIRQHLQWGTQVMWTYGPYGFAYVPYYHFDTWLLGLLIRLSVHTILFIVLACYLARLGSSPWRWLLLAGLFMFPVLAYVTSEYENELAVVLLLYLSATDTHIWRASGMSVLAGCLIALLMTVKGTGMVVAITFLLTYGGFVLATRRPVLVMSLLGSTGLAFLVLWTLAGQSLLNLYAYFRSSYEIISGYTAGMSVLHEYPATYVRQQVAFCAIAIVSSGLVLAWAIWRRERELVCLLLLATPLMFAACKFGFVRFGNQIFFYALAVVIEALILVSVIQRERTAPRLLAALQPAAIAAISLVLVSGVGYAYGALRPPPEWPASQLAVRLSTYRTAAALLVHPDKREEQTAMIPAAIRATYRLEPQTIALLSSGRTDVWPWDIDVFYAYPLRWAPRPVLQSYAAYTRYLDEADAAYLEGPKAPDHVLIAFRAIDYRYFPFDEPAAFRSLSSHYRVVGQDGDFIILAKRSEADSVRLRPVKTVQARLGDVVTVPPSSDGRVYASISVPYSARGQFINLAFQPGELHISFQLADRRTRSYRFIPRVAPDGLMLDTYIENERDLRSYLDGARTEPIHAFQVTSDAPPDYTGRVEVTFFMPA